MKFVTGRNVIAPMDFDYSPEDEAFRRELRTWLEANAPHEPMQSLAGGFEQDEADWNRKLS
jgi:hypothetical protein